LPSPSVTHSTRDFICLSRSFAISSAISTLSSPSWDRSGCKAKGSSQHAAPTQTADGKWTKCMKKKSPAPPKKRTSSSLSFSIVQQGQSRDATVQEAALAHSHTAQPTDLVTVPFLPHRLIYVITRLVPALADEGAQSETSEGELRERSEGEKERRAKVEGLGAEVEGPLFLPSLAFMASTEE